MLRATYLFVFGVIITFASLAFAQETSIDNALRISRQTGKPIFAIASRKVCAPCQLLKSRVANLFRNSPKSDQVVYLRVDLDEQAWTQWSSKFPHQGRMLPIVYLIRADERQMYGQSNTLPGDQLEKFIKQGVAHCGTSYDVQEIKQLEEANQSLKNALNANDVGSAIKLVQTLKPFGNPGNLNSFAVAAVENNRLVQDVAKKSKPFVQERLQSINEQLKGTRSEQFAAIYEFVTLEDSFGEMADHKDALSQVAVQLAIQKEKRELWGFAKRIHDANQHLLAAKSQSEKEDFIKKLTEIESGNAPEVVKLAARQAKAGDQISVAQLQVESISK